MTAKYDRLANISTFINLRNYKILCKFVEDYLMISLKTRSSNPNTWSEIVDYIDTKMLSCPRGVIRDAMVEVLDLHLLQGLDGNLLTMFKDLSGRSLAALRLDALDIAAEAMEKQIRKGNTFFLDPIKMADVPKLAVLVPKILEVREKQVLRLEENPPLTDVYSTYYGFMILNQGSIESDLAGATNNAIETFTQLASQLGKDLELNHTQLKYSKSAFGRVSDEMRELLWNMLSVSVAGQNNRKRAIDTLGMLQDSRALDVLHTRLFATGHERTKRYILKAIKSIGHPKSYDMLQMEASSSWSTRNLQREVKMSLPRP